MARSGGTRVILRKPPSLKSSSLDALRFLPCLCPLCQIHSNHDLGSLPQLDDVDDVLQLKIEQQRIAMSSDQVRPSNRGRNAGVESGIGVVTQ